MLTPLARGDPMLEPTIFMERLWNLWRWLMRALLREPEDDGEEGPIEGAFQIGCLIVTVFGGAAVAIVYLSR